MQHRLTQGICPHLIALRLAYNNYDSAQADNNSWHETRVLSKRITKRLSDKPAAVNNQAITSNSKSSSAKAFSTSGSNASQATTPAADLVLDLSGLFQRSDDKKNIANNATSMAYIYLTIAHKKITIEQSTDEDSTRQQLVFNQPAQAKAAFLQHIARFEAKGFIENQGV